MEPTSKDAADAMQVDTDAVRTVKLQHVVSCRLVSWTVHVKLLSTDVALTDFMQPKEPTTKDVHAIHLHMAVVPTDKLQPTVLSAYSNFFHEPGTYIFFILTHFLHNRFAGCDCLKSPHGCCSDGVSVAYGPRGLVSFMQPFPF